MDIKEVLVVFVGCLCDESEPEDDDLDICLEEDEDVLTEPMIFERKTFGGASKSFHECMQHQSQSPVGVSLKDWWKHRSEKTRNPINRNSMSKEFQPGQSVQGKSGREKHWNPL